jgi:hypothetical protein
MRALLALILMTAAAHAETSFLTTHDDLPLVAGFEEAMDRSVAFATPEGRLSIAVAAGRGDAPGVRAFYAAALPALGWSGADSSDRYARGRDRLTLSFAQAPDGRLEVTYTIFSRPASQAVD